jgi:hypothetical protein
MFNAALLLFIIMKFIWRDVLWLFAVIAGQNSEIMMDSVIRAVRLNGLHRVLPARARDMEQIPRA